MPGAAQPGVLTMTNVPIVAVTAAAGDAVLMVTVDPPPSFRRSLTRLSAAGDPDPGFGDAGRVTFAEGFNAGNATVAGGAYFVGGSHARMAEPGSAMAVVKVPFYVAGTRSDCGASPVYVDRYALDGSPDNGFGDAGELVVDAVGGDHLLTGVAFAVQPGGGPLVAFETARPDTHLSDSGVPRLLTHLPEPGCTITGTTGDDLIEGTGGDDVICALRGDDTIDGGDGHDDVDGGGGTDACAATENSTGCP